jgi:hypothetical protein
MPDSDNRRIRKTLTGDFPPNPRAGYVELAVTTPFSFLRGASDASELAATAHALGHDALGVADLNTMAGVVRVHAEAKKAGLRPVIGCRLRLVSGEEFLAYPRDRAAYGRLCSLLTRGKRHDEGGDWQAKGACDITLADLAAHAEGLQLIVLPDESLPRRLPELPAACRAFAISLSAISIGATTGRGSTGWTGWHRRMACRSLPPTMCITTPPNAAPSGCDDLHPREDHHPSRRVSCWMPMPNAT